MLDWRPRPANRRINIERYGGHDAGDGGVAGRTFPGKTPQNFIGLSRAERWTRGLCGRRTVCDTESGAVRNMCLNAISD